MHTWSIQFQTCISVGKVINTRWCILNVFGLGDWWCSVFVLQEMFPCLLPWRVTRWNCPATSRLPFSPTVFALSSIFVTILLSPFTRECIKSKRDVAASDHKISFPVTTLVVSHMQRPGIGLKKRFWEDVLSFAGTWNPRDWWLTTSRERMLETTDAEQISIEHQRRFLTWD